MTCGKRFGSRRQHVCVKTVNKLGKHRGRHSTRVPLGALLLDRRKR